MTDDERAAYIEVCPAFGLDEKGESAFDMSTEECHLCEQQDRNTYNACWEEWKQADPLQAQEVSSEPPTEEEMERIENISESCYESHPTGRAKVTEAPKPEKEKQKITKKEKKLTKFAAAIIILDKANSPLSCEEIVSRIAEQGLWASTKGNCAAYGLYRCFLIEMKKGDESRIYRSGKDKYKLRRKDGN